MVLKLIDIFGIEYEPFIKQTMHAEFNNNRGRYTELTVSKLVKR